MYRQTSQEEKKSEDLTSRPVIVMLWLTGTNAIRPNTTSFTFQNKRVSTTPLLSIKSTWSSSSSSHSIRNPVAIVLQLRKLANHRISVKAMTQSDFSTIGDDVNYSATSSPGAWKWMFVHLSPPSSSVANGLRNVVRSRQEWWTSLSTWKRRETNATTDWIVSSRGKSTWYEIHLANNMIITCLPASSRNAHHHDPSSVRPISDCNELMMRNLRVSSNCSP